MDPNTRQQIIGKQDFLKLLETRGSTEALTIMPKVNTVSHLYVKEQDRQSVSVACQLLSKTVADGIIELFPRDMKMKRLSDFARKCDSWFDAFNSHIKINKLKSHKSAFGVDLDMDFVNQMDRQAFKKITNRHFFQDIQISF